MVPFAPTNTSTAISSMKVPFMGMTAPMDFTNSFGALEIGCLASAILYGVNLSEMWTYYSHFKRDSIYIKIMIAWFGLLDTVFLITSLNALWFWTVTEWGNLAGAAVSPWGWIGMPIVMGLLVASVQCYFAFRVYILSGRKNPYLAGLIVLGALTGFGFSCATFASSLQLTSANALGSVLIPFTGWMSTATGCDGVITIGMLWYMQRTKTQFAMTQAIMTRWSRLALETNLVTASGSLAASILFKYTPKFIFLAVYFPAGRFYFLSCLAVVNSRRSITEDVRAGITPPSSKARWGTSTTGSNAPVQTLQTSRHHPAQEVHILTEVTQSAGGEKDGLRGYQQANEYNPGMQYAMSRQPVQRPAYDQFSDPHPFANDRLSGSPHSERMPV